MSILRGSKDTTKITWSAEGAGGGTSIEDVEEGEGELDLDLDFFVFLDFLDFGCFLNLLLDILVGAAATGTDPKDPPKGNIGPRVGMSGAKELAAN